MRAFLCNLFDKLEHKLFRKHFAMEQISSNQAWGGQFLKFKIASSPALGSTATQIGVYVPPVATKGSKVPVLYYLAGLTCTEDVGAQKGGFLRDASEQGVALVFPDTSPRGAKIDGEEDDYVNRSSLIASFVCCRIEVMRLLVH